MRVRSTMEHLLSLLHPVRPYIIGTGRMYFLGLLRVLLFWGVQPKASGKLSLRLNPGMRLIVDKYRKGKLKRTLKS